MLEAQLHALQSVHAALLAQIDALRAQIGPAESELAILDSHSGSGAFAIDRTAAAKSLERLRTAGTPRPLVEVIQRAISLVKQKLQVRKEIYVFSDITEAAWKSAASADLKQLLAKNSGVLLYVIDVGVEKSQNFALGDLTLSGDVLPAGADLTIETQVSSSGISGPRERLAALRISTGKRQWIRKVFSQLMAAAFSTITIMR